MHFRMNKTLLVKYIISFSLILIFTAAMMAFTFQSFLLKNLNEFNDKQQKDLLMKGVENVQEEIAGVYTMLEQFNLYRELNPVYIQRGAAQMKEAQSELKKIIRTDNGVVHECILVSGSYEFALSNLTTYRPEYFLELLESPLFSECRGFSDVMEVLRANPVMPVRVRGTDVLALNLVYQYNGFRSDTYAMVLLESSKVMDRFSIYEMTGGNTHALIFLKDSPVLSTLSEPVSLEQIRKHDSIVLGGNSYKVVFYEEPGDEFTYVYLADEAQYRAPINKTSRQFLLSLVVIFLVGSGMIVLLALYNYRPIRMLQDSIEKHLNRKRIEEDEFTFISRGIDQIVKDNIYLSDTLNIEKRQLKNICLFKLLNGVVQDKKAVTQMLREVDICFDREYVQCISINLAHADDVDFFSKRIEEEGRSGTQYCMFYYLINGTSVTLVFTFDGEDAKMVEWLLNGFLQFYSETIPMTIGVGEAVSGIDNLPKSYHQSLVALRYVDTGVEQSKVRFREIKFSDNVEKLYNGKQVNALFAAIRKNDMEGVTRELVEVKKFIQQNRMPHYVIKAMYYQIVNGVLINSHNPRVFEKGNEILLVIGEVLQRYSVEELHEQIETLCFQLVNQTSNVVLLDKLLDYINQHCVEMEFSIAGMAEEFKMSHQQLSTMFKKEMHITIMEYITNYKMAMAVELLTKTTIPIAEIVKRMGYIDNSSFTRKFKQAKGMTPAEYRKCFGEDDN